MGSCVFSCLFLVLSLILFLWLGVSAPHLCLSDVFLLCCRGWKAFGLIRYCPWAWPFFMIQDDTIQTKKIYKLFPTPALRFLFCKFKDKNALSPNPPSSPFFPRDHLPLLVDFSFFFSQQTVFPLFPPHKRSIKTITHYHLEALHSPKTSSSVTVITKYFLWDFLTFQKSQFCKEKFIFRKSHFQNFKIKISLP